jgi:RNA polymerase sigma-70 factor (ECF subfamily)
VQDDVDSSDADAELERLARLAGAGDRAALEEFLRRIKGPVVRYCRSKLVGSTGTHTADDVAQEVLLAVCEALPRYRPDGSSVMAFVFGIARFKLVDAFRASGRNHSVPTDSLPEKLDPEPGPELAAVLSTEVVRLRAALQMLLPHHREVLGLRVAMGYSGAEVATLLGTTPGAVRVTQHRALVKLRGILADLSAPED